MTLLVFYGGFCIRDMGVCKIFKNHQYHHNHTMYLTLLVFLNGSLNLLDF